jgi:hypothetical protein
MNTGNGYHLQLTPKLVVFDSRTLKIQLSTHPEQFKSLVYGDPVVPRGTEKTDR